MSIVSLDRQISGLFDIPVSVATQSTTAPSGELLAQEQAAVARALPVRQLEYTAGRVAARSALGELGFAPSPLLPDLDRLPIWPNGAIGSLSHGGGVCAAVVARTEAARALAIDIEENADLARDLWPEVLIPSEIDWLSVQPAKSRGKLARLIFSAKESVYKCQFPLTRATFGFDALQIDIDQRAATFDATFLTRAGQFDVGDCLTGLFCQTDDYLITTATLAH
jgi:4'-phosphopantetheinyl transferase EntD